MSSPGGAKSVMRPPGSRGSARLAAMLGTVLLAGPEVIEALLTQEATSEHEVSRQHALLTARAVGESSRNGLREGGCAEDREEKSRQFSHREKRRGQRDTLTP